MFTKESSCTSTYNINQYGNFLENLGGCFQSLHTFWERGFSKKKFFGEMVFQEECPTVYTPGAQLSGRLARSYQATYDIPRSCCYQAVFASVLPIPPMPYAVIRQIFLSQNLPNNCAPGVY